MIACNGISVIVDGNVDIYPYFSAIYPCGALANWHKSKYSGNVLQMSKTSQVIMSSDKEP